MRTTAFPASIIAQMMARGDIKEKGAIPQERCVPPDAFIRELAARGITIKETLTSESISVVESSRPSEHLAALPQAKAHLP